MQRHPYHPLHAIELLLEHNLALKVSVLDVVANISNDSTKPVDSVVNFEIQYSEPKTENSDQQTFAKYELVTISDIQIPLNLEASSQDCGEKR